jgi:hypothetical protein
MAAPTDLKTSLTLSPAQARSRRARNIAIGLAVGGLVILFYIVTIAKLGGHVFQMFDGP